jgi:hypothetical protein
MTNTGTLTINTVSLESERTPFRLVQERHYGADFAHIGGQTAEHMRVAATTEVRCFENISGKHLSNGIISMPNTRIGVAGRVPTQIDV